MSEHRRATSDRLPALAAAVFEAKAVLESAVAEYKAEVTMLHNNGVYLTALAENAPFTYATLRAWVLAEHDKVDPEPIPAEESSK